MVVAGAGVAPMAALGPGFRFHPTDEELVGYFLKRKVAGKPLRFECIAEIDLYKFEPSDLPGQSRLKTGDLQWYFYTALDKKYGHGSRTNRATGQGYWKTTGKDHQVANQARPVGLRKTLVYHTGRAPNGERTNWVMHEYRLVDEELVRGGISQDAYVLCTVFQKSGAGPKNGEQYGAPFIEEEWEDEMHGIDLGNMNTDDNTTESDGCLGVDVVNATTSNDFHLQEMQQPLKIISQAVPLTLGLTDSNPEFHLSQSCLNEQMLMKENEKAICHVKFPNEDYIEMNDVITPMNVGCSSCLHDEMFNSNVNDENTCNEFLSVDESFLQQDDLFSLINIPETGLSETDWVEEVLKHMSNVDDNLQACSTLNTFSLSALQSGITEIPVAAQASQEHDIAGASSSKRKANSSHNGFKEKAIGDSEFIEFPDAADIWNNDFGDGWGEPLAKRRHDLWNNDFGDGWGEPLAKRRHGMLGSIPSCPAFAAESPFKGKAKVMEHKPGVTLAGPLRIQAGVYLVGDNCMAHLIPHNWLLTKEGITQERFLITCATESPIRNQKVATFSLFQSGFLLCFMWVVLFAIGVKIGVCVYAR